MKDNKKTVKKDLIIILSVCISVAILMVALKTMNANVDLTVVGRYIVVVCTAVCIILFARKIQRTKTVQKIDVINGITILLLIYAIFKID